ncbi:MAG: hypothetical protein FJX52_04220 [Alphaproteobacteria bacterium]|nr:hypothetical protein [Alphaproteobacteria bacterium]
MLETGDFDAIACFFASVGFSPQIAPKLRDAMAAVRRKYPDVPLFMAMTSSPEMIAALAAERIMHYEDPVALVAALGALVRFGRNFDRSPHAKPPLPAPLRPAPRGPFGEQAAKAVLAAAGIPVVPERLAGSAEEAVAAARHFGFPVALKISSPDIAHKTEVSGVMLDLADAPDVSAAFAAIMTRVQIAAPRVGIEGVLVTPMIKGGVEMLLGVQRDPVFGPTVMVGMGGIFAEIIGDVALRPAPFDDRTALELIGGLRGFPLLNGARGRPKMDTAALARAVATLSCFAAANADAIDSIDINPFIVLPQDAVAVDALVIARAQT